MSLKVVAKMATIVCGIVALSGLVLVVLAFCFAPSFLTRSSAYEQYICTTCGLKKAESSKKFRTMVYHRQVTFEESAISRAIKAQNCSHTWLLYRYGRSSRRPFVSTHVDGGSPSSTLQILLVDDVFGQELSQTDNPSKSWASLVSALHSNRAFDEAFGSWYLESDRCSFSSYAATNGLSTPNVR